jgi:hypothetical protein
MTAEDPRLFPVAIDPRVSDEHPGLRVWTASVPAGAGRTRPSCATGCGCWQTASAAPRRSRCGPGRCLGRTACSTAISGSTPDVTRTPVEELAVERLLKGRFSARGLPEDALALATLETGVPVYAVDAAGSPARWSWRPTRAGGSCWPTRKAPSPCSSSRRSPTARPAATRGRWRCWPCRRPAWTTSSSRRPSGRPRPRCAVEAPS